MNQAPTLARMRILKEMSESSDRQVASEAAWQLNDGLERLPLTVDRLAIKGQMAASSDRWVAETARAELQKTIGKPKAGLLEEMAATGGAANARLGANAYLAGVESRRRQTATPARPTSSTTSSPDWLQKSLAAVLQQNENLKRQKASQKAFAKRAKKEAAAPYRAMAKSVRSFRKALVGDQLKRDTKLRKLASKALAL